MSLSKNFSYLRHGLVSLSLILPWLWPFASGPSPAVTQWLVTLACAALLWHQRSAIDAAVLARALRVAAIVSTSMGLAQYYGLAWPFYPLVHPGQVGEAFANLRQRNQFATLTSMGLAAVIWLGAVRVDEPNRWSQVGTMLAAVLLAVGNAASSSRTGLLHLLVLAVLLALWGGWRQPATRRLMLIVLGAYGLALWLLPLLGGMDPAAHGAAARIAAMQEPVACQSRLTLWANVLHLISLRPWLGWGWGELDYAHFVTLYDGERFCEILDNAHNLPLQLAVELGLPATLSILGGAVAWVVRARPWRETLASRQMLWAVLAVLLVHSLLEYPLWYGPFLMTLVLCVLLLHVLSAPVSAGVGVSAVARVHALAVCAVLLLTAYAAWDYWRVSQIFYPPDYRAVAYREHTLEKIQGTWLFRDEVHFAEFTTTPLTTDNAARLNDLGKQVLHFSPEAQVVRKLIETAQVLGRYEEAAFYMARYRAAFPVGRDLSSLDGPAAKDGPTIENP